MKLYIVNDKMVNGVVNCKIVNEVVNVIVLWLFTSSLFAQDIKMRDVFANAPDSIFPLMTKNNRLDCIDFIENNMPARVKNRFDESCELKALTADYLLMQTSEVSHVEMKMLPRPAEGDTLLCVVRTYSAPATDSHLSFYSMQWQPVQVEGRAISADAFLPSDADPEIVGIMRALPFVKMSLSPNKASLTYELQTTELNKAQRQAISDQLFTIELLWDGKTFR